MSEALRIAPHTSTADARRSQFFVALVIVDVLSGLADSLSGPYLILFLVNELGLSPLKLSAVLTTRALCGIAFGTLFGAWVDKKTSTAPLIIAIVGSAAGYGLLAFTTNFSALLAVVAVPTAIGAAVFPQSVALLRNNFSRADPFTANRAMGVMRASWSLAWAFGPAIGAAVVALYGFRGVFLASSAFAAIALVTLTLLKAKPESRRMSVGLVEKPANGGVVIAIAFLALILFHTAMFLGNIPIAIVITSSLGGAQSDVGWAFSICAGLEIVVMGAIIWRPLRRREPIAIMAGFAAFAAYFAVLVFAQSVAVVLWAQILRAIAIGLVSYLGIGFLHSLLPHRPGVAAALFSNAGQIGSVAAALSVGLLANAFGYASVFAVCAVLSMAGIVLVAIVRTRRR